MLFRLDISGPLPTFNRTEHNLALMSRKRPGASHTQVVDDGADMLFLLVTIVAYAISLAGLLLFSLVAMLLIILRPCQSQPMSAVFPKATDSFCDSFIMNAEVNNLQGWLLPEDCVTEVKEYMTAKYFVDFLGAIGAAEDYLNSLQLKGDGFEVVVMDVDETVLSNLPYYVKHNYGAEVFNEDIWNHWVDEECALPLDASVTFFNQLKARNVKVAFLTGRPESQRNATARNLVAAGYQGWSALILRSPSEEGMLALDYKSRRRLQLELDGFRILSSIGDQWSDLSGPAIGNRTFKLPNPMYYIF